MSHSVVVARIPSVTQADLMADHLRHQGIDAVVRTYLDRTTYAGLGGASLLVPLDQRLEAELELVLLDEAIPDGIDDYEPATDGVRERRMRWIRTIGVVLLAAMVVATVAPSAMIIWTAAFG